MRERGNVGERKKGEGEGERWGKVRKVRARGKGDGRRDGCEGKGERRGKDGKVRESGKG